MRIVSSILALLLASGVLATPTWHIPPWDVTEEELSLPSQKKSFTLKDTTGYRTRVIQHLSQIDDESTRRMRVVIPDNGGEYLFFDNKLISIRYRWNNMTVAEWNAMKNGITEGMGPLKRTPRAGYEEFFGQKDTTAMILLHKVNGGIHTVKLCFYWKKMYRLLLMP